MQTLFLLFLAICMASARKPRPSRIDEDAKLTTLQLVDKYGYHGEEHFVQTVDGYILALHRIRPKEECQKELGVVLLQHGFLTSSALWVMMGPENGLGYFLSQKCYDVWMGNSRGNRYSRNHTSLSPNSVQFWDFSWHEMGVYDLPATIKYIIQNTKREDLSYIGHSQGATSFLVFSSMSHPFQYKINLMVALAPIAFLSHSDSMIIPILARHGGKFESLVPTTPPHEILHNSDQILQAVGKMCKNSELICQNLGFPLIGYDESQIDYTKIPVIFGHLPAGSSTKQFIHYEQLRKSGKFQMFCYGASNNTKLYGQATPPDYRLENIETKIFIGYGNYDALTNGTDIETLNSKLKHSKKYLVPSEQWNHFDFFVNVNAKDLVYNNIIKVLAKFKY